MVDIKDTKTHVPRQFVITEGSVAGCNLLGIVRQYISLRKPHNRFFLGYRNGQCFTQPVGINTIGSIPKKIAIFLSLPIPESYTGHCFRRSSATLLAEAGADLSVLMRHAGWKSPTVAEGYVEASVANKCKIAKQILGDITCKQNVLTDIACTSSQVTIVKKTTALTQQLVSVPEELIVVPPHVPQELIVKSEELVTAPPQLVTVVPQLLDIPAQLAQGTDQVPSLISRSTFSGCNFYFGSSK